MSSAASESFAERSLTPSLENYLKIIFHEELESGSAHASAIADAAGVSRAARFICRGVTVAKHGVKLADDRYCEKTASALHSSLNTGQGKT